MNPLIVSLIAHNLVLPTSGKTMILKWTRQASEYCGPPKATMKDFSSLKLGDMGGQYVRSNHCTLVPCPRGKVGIM